MADEYQCDECKQMTDTIYFYRPLCEKCYRKQKNRDGNDTSDGTFIAGSESLKEEAICSDIGIKPSHG
jgi:hypothetical protein